MLVVLSVLMLVVFTGAAVVVVTVGVSKLLSCSKNYHLVESPVTSNPNPSTYFT